MSHYVYILVSERNGRSYIGSSNDVAARLKYHNAGRVKATRYYRPFRLTYSEEHETAREARQREYQLKQFKSRRLIDELIRGGAL